jgi:flagellar hook-basal body complex protein FliE
MSTINSHLGIVRGGGALPTTGVGSGVGSTGAGSFAEMLEGYINEVAKLQQDASAAVERLATNQTDDVAGVMTAIEKSDIAFKTLLAIRGKLMDAYEEIRNMPL